MANAFKWPGQPQKLPLPLGGSAPHLIHGQWAHPSLRPKQHVDRFDRFSTAHRRVSHYITMGRYVSPKELPRPLGRSGPPSNTWYQNQWPTKVINPNGISISSAVFVWVPNALLHNALSTGTKTPKLPLPLGFCTYVSQGDKLPPNGRGHATHI